jgi:hypothetical protein
MTAVADSAVTTVHTVLATALGDITVVREAAR